MGILLSRKNKNIFIDEAAQPLLNRFKYEKGYIPKVRILSNNDDFSHIFGRDTWYYIYKKSEKSHLFSNDKKMVRVRRVSREKSGNQGFILSSKNNSNNNKLFVVKSHD